MDQVVEGEVLLVDGVKWWRWWLWQVANQRFLRRPANSKETSLPLATHLLSKLSFEEWQPKNSPLKWTLRVGGATKKKYPKSIFLFPSNFFLQDQGALTIIDAS